MANNPNNPNNPKQLDLFPPPPISPQKEDLHPNVKTPKKQVNLNALSLILDGEIKYSFKYCGLISYKIVLQNGSIVEIKYKNNKGINRRVGFKEFIDKDGDKRRGIRVIGSRLPYIEFRNLTAFVEEVCKSYYNSLANSQKSVN